MARQSFTITVSSVIKFIFCTFNEKKKEVIFHSNNVVLILEETEKKSPEEIDYCFGQLTE